MGHVFGSGAYGSEYYGEGLPETLSGTFTAYLEAPLSSWVVCAEVYLDDKVYYFSTEKLKPEMRPILLSAPGTVSHKIQLEAGKTSIGTTSFTIAEDDLFKPLLAAQHWRNRWVDLRVCPRDGNYDEDSYLYFSGLITDYKLRDNKLTIELRDPLKDSSKKIPELKQNQAQLLRYGSPTTNINGNDATTCGLNPLTIMEDLLVRSGIFEEYIDQPTFASEKAGKLTSWKFFRVLHGQKSTKSLLNELQVESLCHLCHKGQEISVRVFYPPSPFDDVLSIDGDEIRGSLSLSGKMEENFYNRVEVLYDYDEDEYNSVMIFNNTQSQEDWREVRTKTIESKWIKSNGVYQSSRDSSGFTVVYASPELPPGTFHVDFTYEGGDAEKPRLRLKVDTQTGTAGPWEGCQKAGYVTLEDGASPIQTVKVLCDPSLFPSGDTTAMEFEIEELPGDRMARWLGNRYLNWFKDGVPEISFRLPLHKIAHEGEFLKTAQIVELTSPQASMYDSPEFESKRLLLLKVKPNFSNYRASLSAAVAELIDDLYLYIAPDRLHQVDWADASTDDKRYGGFANDDDDMMEDDRNPGYKIW